MTEDTDTDPETSDAAFLREVADWIFNTVTPAMGLDQYHVERLQELATRMDTLEAMGSAGWPEPNPRRPFDASADKRAKAGLPHYRESDRDYLANNNDLAVHLLDAYILRRQTVQP